MISCPKKAKVRKVLLIIFPWLAFSWILFALPISVKAQDYQSFSSEMERIAQTVKWRIGPFRIFPAIQIRNIGYDNNVYFVPEDREPVSDYTATIAAQIETYLLFGNWLILSFKENPEYVFYAEEKQQRSLNNSYSPGFRLLVLNRFVLSGDYQSRRAKRRETSEFDAPVYVKNEGYSGSLFLETARRTSLGFSGASEKISYEDITHPGEEISLARALNRREESANFEFYYRIFSDSYFFVNTGYTESTYEYSESRWRDSYSYQIYSGVRFPIFGRSRGTLSIGYKKLILRSAEKQGFSGPVGNTRLEFRLGRLSFRLIYQRDSRFSYAANNAYFVEDRYGTGLSFYLTRSLRLDYDFSYGEGNYPELIPIRLPDGSIQDMERKDVYRSHSAGFVIRIIRNTGIGLTFNSWERNSTISVYQRNRMFLGGYITYDF